MSENRTIVEHARHGVQGPHSHQPAGFVPLRLRLETEGERIEVTCPVALVGRHSDADLRIAHPEISRRHCRFAFEDGVWRVRDLQSLNGVVLNNAPIVEATLYAGDRLRLGCVGILIEAATAMKLLPIDDDRNDKLRQIIQVLPADQRRAG
jgi:pSer/pThr/pTyr-binding forkhead associated (FHA) protein